MVTPKQIKRDKIEFKIGSYEWLTHYGLPIGLMTIGIIGLYFMSKDLLNKKQLNFIYIQFHLPLFLFGLLTYWIQLRKLTFKSFTLNSDS